MSAPLDLSLINQLLNEQRTKGDLNNLTKPGFFYVLWPTNTPNDRKDSCHVINLFNYGDGEHTAENHRTFQIYINDNKDINTVWYRQYANGWTAWERFVTATDLADYYNKTDVDALINTINTQLNLKASYGIMPLMDAAAVKIYDNNGTEHSETVDDCSTVIVGTINDLAKLEKTHVHFTLQDDYPVNTKLTKIAISTEAFSTGQALPATITIKNERGTKIVATLDTDNSDTEFFIYNVPTNLQTVPIAKGGEFDVYFLQ